MEVVNVKNVIIKYIPEHIVVETYVLSNNTQTAESARQTNTKNKSNHQSHRTDEPLEDLFYISMDESLDPDSDCENNCEVDVKEFTEEEYLEVDDDVQEMFIESGEDVDNAELVEMESHGTNDVQKDGSIQLLRDWFYDHLDVMFTDNVNATNNFHRKINFFVFSNLLQNPYPAEKEKESFCMLTSLSLVQVTILLFYPMS